MRVMSGGVTFYFVRVLVQSTWLSLERHFVATRMNKTRQNLILSLPAILYIEGSIINRKDSKYEVSRAPSREIRMTYLLPVLISSSGTQMGSPVLLV